MNAAQDCSRNRENYRTWPTEVHDIRGTLYSCSYILMHMRAGTFAIQTVQVRHSPHLLAIHTEANLCTVTILVVKCRQPNLCAHNTGIHTSTHTLTGTIQS